MNGESPDISGDDGGWVDIGDVSDADFDDSGFDEAGRRRRTAGPTGPADAGRGRPAQRRQVDPGQPHPRRPPGGRPGRAGGDQGPGRLRRQLARPGSSPWSTPAAGWPGRRAWPPRWPSRRRSPSASPTRSCSWWTPGSARPTRTRRSRGCCAGRASRSCSSPTRWTTPRARPTRRRCGRSASASRSWSPPCTAAAAATCSTWRSRRCPRRRKERIGEAGPRRVALIGKPNVGKSSLLNKLVGEQRAVVDSVAGTTRDPVDELIELGGTTWRFVDTAGHQAPVQGKPGRRLLRDAAHPVRARPGRGRGRAHRRERAAHRAGPAHPHRW